MCNEEIIRKIEELLAYEKSIEALKANADEVRNALKAELENRGTSELVVSTYVVRNTPVLSSRFDTKRFKEDFGADAYKEYCKEVYSNRFSIA